MGTWDCDAFANDTAADFVCELENTSDFSLIHSAIQNVLDCGSDYLDAYVSEEAFVACEALARLKGHFGIPNPDSEALDAWVAKQKLNPPQDLLDAAKKAIDRILCEPSELLELWEESEEFEKWKELVEELKTRLG